MHKCVRQDLKTARMRIRMMNVWAMCVIVSWVAAAGFWSDQDGTKVIVREGHRVVVVEYDDKGHHNTKVSIGAEGRTSVSDSPRICDAYGKCKNKILNAFGKGAEADHNQATEAVKDGAYDAQETAKDQAYKVTESSIHRVKDAKEALKDRAYDAKEAGKDRAYDAKEAVEDRACDAKEALKKRAYDAKEAVRERASDAKEALKDRACDAKEALKDRAYDAKEALKDRAYDAKKALKDRAYDAKEATEDSLGNAIHKANKVRGAVGNVVKKAKDRAYDATREGAYKVRDRAHIMGLLGFTTALGTSMWVTFVSSYVLARAMGRNQFGVVQSKLYPVYFKVMACCIGTALLGLSSRAEGYQAYNLSACLLSVLANLFLIEPRATKVMLGRMKIHKEEGRGIGDAETSSITRAVPGTNSSRVSVGKEDSAFRARVDQLNRKLKRYNSCSSALNLLTLLGLLWHLVYLNHLIQNCAP